MASGASKAAEHEGKLPYMPQLDGLRVFAVLGVLVHHFLNVETFTWSFLKLPWGHLGVRLFFVLSGFLITGILLRCRAEADVTGQRWYCVRQFYLRRSLRIFPLYYLVIIVGFLLNIPPIRDVFSWLFTYTINFYYAQQGDWLPQVGHLWTLAVEEQFYLAWPWVVLFAPRKWLLPVMVGVVLMGPIYRAYAVLNNFNPVAVFTVTLACMDTLGMGALLALMVHSCKRESVGRILNCYALPLGITACITLHLFAGSNLGLNNILLDLALGLVFAWLVYSASCGFRGRFGALLQSAPMVYLGRISYGIYVFHYFTPLFVWPLLARWELSVVEWQLWNFAISTSATLVVAVLSWHLFEKPINDLKHLVKYSPAFKAVTAP